MKFSHSAKRLIANSSLYEASLEWVRLLNGNPKTSLNAISLSGLLAWSYHPGRFADGALENLALRFGANDVPRVDAGQALPGLRPGKGSRTLHVATEIYPTGGHSRVLAKWVLRDTTTDHGIVLTRHGGPMPGFLEQAVAKSGGSLLRLPTAESALSRAGQLRSLSRKYDRVVLHHHPDDPVPSLAFAHDDLPPVAMFNHAHFGFSFGATVSDVVVNTQTYFEGMSRKFRFARRTALLTPIAGLTELTKDVVDKESAKARLGFDRSAHVIMTIGHERAFRPIEGHNFFHTSARLLKANPGIHMLIVGVPSDGALVPPELRGHPRFHCVGPVNDPEPYYRAADICLASFPMSALGALVESVAYGEAFPVPVYGEGESILRPNLSPYFDSVYRPVDEPDYVHYVTRLVADLPAVRERAHQLRLSIVHTDEDFGGCLRKLNQTIDSIRHVPAEIPTSGMIDSPDTRMVAEIMPPNLFTTIYNRLPIECVIRTRTLTRIMGVIPPRVISPFLNWVRKH